MLKALVYVILGQVIQQIKSTWYYRDYDDPENDLYYPKTVFELVYEPRNKASVDNFIWLTPKLCDFVKTTKDRAFIRCPYPGIYPIGLIENCVTKDPTCAKGQNDVENFLNKMGGVPLMKFIEISNVRHCFAWGVNANINHQISPNVTASVELILKIWLSQREDISIGLDLFSNSSHMKYAEVTRYFARKGNLPDIAYTSSHLPDAESNMVPNSSVRFRKKLAYFEVIVRNPIRSTIKKEISLTINRDTLGIYDCYIKKATLNIPLAAFRLPPIPKEEILYCKEYYGEAKLFRDPCSPNHVIFFVNNSLLITQDNFKTIKQISCSIARPNGAEEITHAQFMSGGIIIYMTAAKSLWLFNDSLTSFYYHLKTPVKINDFKTMDWCYSDSLPLTLNQELYVWSDLNIYKLVLEYPLEISKELKLNLQSWHLVYASKPGEKLTDVFRLAHFYYLAFACIKKINGKFTMVYYKINQINQNVSLLGQVGVPFVPLSNGQLQSYQSISLNTLKFSALLWSSDEAYVVKHTYGGMEVKKVYTKLSPAFSHIVKATTIPKESAIKQVMVDINNQLFILLQNYSILYTWAELIDDMITLETGFEYENKNVRINLDSQGSLWIVQLQMPTIKRKYNLGAEIIGSHVNLSHVCPFINLALDPPGTDIVYFMDRGEKINMSASIFFQTKEAEKIKVFINHDHLLNFGIKNLSERIGTLGMLITNKVDIEAKSTKGLSIIEMKPIFTNLHCSSEDYQRSYVFLKCPPKRNLKVKLSFGTLSQDCNNEEFQLVRIPDHHNFNGRGTKMIKYDKAAYGCPWLYPFNRPLLPLISLYDGDEFVRHLRTTNYVVYEINGRSDFDYNATMLQINCRRPATNYEEFVNFKRNSKEKHSSREGYTISDYFSSRSCFEDQRKEVETDHYEIMKVRPYEILNFTGQSAITFSTNPYSLYVFTVIPIDPHLSFCDLNATFALKIYGYQAATLASRYPIAMELSLVLIILLASVYYIIFSPSKKEEIRVFKEELAKSN